MKISSLASTLLTGALIAGLAGCAMVEKTDVAAVETAPTKVVVGWMTSWATAGQIMQAMIHTNIGDLYEFKPEFHSFLFGPDINEAALAGKVDVQNSGLVPTISLLAASEDWIVIGRLIDSPLSIVARQGSGIKTLGDLKGKTIAVPFGGGSHPYVLQRLEATGLTCGKEKGDVKLINLKPSEQAIAITQGSVEAVGTWEPQTALILSKKMGYVIDSERHLGVISIRKQIAKAHPELVEKLLREYIEANYYVALHGRQTDQWFIKAAGFPEALLGNLKVIEPNTKAKNIDDININLSEEDIALGQRYADTMQKAGLLARPVNFKERVDLSYLENVLKTFPKQGSKTDLVKVTGD